MRVIILSFGFITCLACSSAKSRDEALSLESLLSRAEELRQAGNTDTAAYERLLFDLETLRTRDTALCQESAQREKAAAALANYPALQCEVRITEPREKLFTATGFASPLRIIAECPANAPFAFEADSKTLSLSGDGMRFSNGYLNARLRVASASSDADKNVIQLSAHYYAQPLIERLGEACALKTGSGITLVPAEYRIHAAPIDASSPYDLYRRNFRQAEYETAAEEGETRSEAALSSTGQFTVGARYRGKNFDLLYGHPNGELPDGIGTSFTTVRVDGTDYRFEQQKLKRSKRRDGALLAETHLPGTDISLTQIIEPQKSAERARIRIAYQIRNSGKIQHRVGIRLLLDTWAGKNDGVPFVLPAGGVEQLVRTERELSPAEALLWHTFDPTGSAAAVQPTLEGFLAGTGLTPPDRLAIVNWPNAADTIWEYATHEERRITGDSAVLYWWLPAAIEPGQTQIVATEVGAYLQTRQPRVFVTNPASGDLLVYLWHHNDTDKAQRVSYVLNADKGECIFQKKPAAAELEPGGIYAQAIPAQILAEGESTIVLKETINDSTREYRFPVQNLKRWKQLAAPLVAESGSQLPVSYFDERELELYVRLRDAAGGLVSKTKLSRQKIEGGYAYTGLLTLPPGVTHGRFSIEVVR
jgi:hypothetical protein